MRIVKKEIGDEKVIKVNYGIVDKYKDYRLSSQFMTREVALIAIFAALWAVLQVHFGPIVGRFSLGPLSLHGSVNRVVGWLLMTILAEQTKGFGRITLMTAVAAFGTRIIRANPLEGLIVGSGYILGGFIFDLVANSTSRKRKGYYLLASTISGLGASIPYLLSKVYFLGLASFIVISSVYIFSTAKGLFFSLLGCSLGIQVSGRVKKGGS